MRIFRFLILVGIIGLGHHWWKNHEKQSATAVPSGPGGFISVAMPDGAAQDTVIILAPVNCPSGAAQRADRLAESLTRIGIPNVRSSSYSANFSDATPEQEAALQRAVEVMKGEIPAVFVNGMGKANPSADEVAAVFQKP